MERHPRHHRHRTHDHEAGTADLLDLDAEALGTYLDDLTAWADGHTDAAPGLVADVGAGTGTGTLALARRFPEARVVAVDRSPLMLDRLRDTARERGEGDRVRVVEADLDAAWPPVGTLDLAWASSSLHHVADPDRLLTDLYAALRPGGLLVVVEMDAPPRFLPEDLGIGRPGLEERCHEIGDLGRWNAHPNWGPHLERAGFAVAEERGFDIAVHPAPPSARRYARLYLRRVRSALAGRLDAGDLDTLDRLLADDGPHAITHRGDVAVRGSRTAWAAHRV
ncbi:class I SAM-dependent methyltransferase [Nocardiopsis sp. NPDC050513]|uniref:class I SAM-dependent methyltransferase n=1 Tax=Nocardiopsis sp. NPDC050513 TaxID=3364338 RepID=UPI003797025D